MNHKNSVESKEKNDEKIIKNEFENTKTNQSTSNYLMESSTDVVSRSPTSANIDSFKVVSTNAIFNRFPASIVFEY